MSKNTVTYLIGRLNLIASYNNKSEYLYKSISSGTIVNSRTRKYKYGIFEIYESNIMDEYFITGTLTKFVSSEDSEVVNIEKRTIDTDLFENQVDAKSKFILHPQSGFIAFNPVGQSISEHAFREKFSEIIHKSNILIRDVDIQIISEEFGVFRALKEFDIINKVSISLHPSNPNMRDIWKEVDKELQSSNVETYTSNYSSKNGLKIDEENKIYSEIAMASDGYGNAKIIGKTNNENKVASTNKIPVTCEVNKEDTETVNKSVLTKFKELWERMKK